MGGRCEIRMSWVENFLNINMREEGGGGRDVYKRPESMCLCNIFIEAMKHQTFKHAKNIYQY